MESSIDYSNDTNITKLLNDFYSDVPLIATYLKILVLLVTIPAIITPAAVIIHIIRKTKELHTKYCLFLVNLLIGDILTTIRFCFEIFNIRIYISDIPYIILTIPRVVVQYSFVLLAIDRIVGVAFPYRYRNIMKPRVVYALIASVWIIAAVLLFLIIITSHIYLLWSFGVYVPQSIPSSIFKLYVLPQPVSAIIIVVINLYLYRSVIQSKRKLESNLKLSGKDEHKVTKLQQLIYNLQMQLKSSLPLFVLGGVDCFLNVLRVVIFIIISVKYPPSSGAIPRAYFMQYLVNPLEYCQIISHSITYGVYKKPVRKKLPAPSKTVSIASKQGHNFTSTVITWLCTYRVCISVNWLMSFNFLMICVMCLLCTNVQKFIKAFTFL